jgi:hypothetical protein
MKTFNKLLIIVLIIFLSLTFVSCTSTLQGGGYVVEKIRGDACVIRLGKLTVLDATQTQTGYVLVLDTGEEIAVEKEVFYSTTIGDYITYTKR